MSEEPDDVVICVDENIKEVRHHLKDLGYPVFWLPSGTEDPKIHEHLCTQQTENPRRLVLITRDRDFRRWADRPYFLYIIDVPSLVLSGFELTMAVHNVLEQHLPNLLSCEEEQWFSLACKAIGIGEYPSDSEALWREKLLAEEPC